MNTAIGQRVRLDRWRPVMDRSGSDLGASVSALARWAALVPKRRHINRGERNDVAMGEVNPEESLEVGRGVFKRLGDCAGSEIESAIGLIGEHDAASATGEASVVIGGVVLAGG